HPGGADHRLPRAVDTGSGGARRRSRRAAVTGPAAGGRVRTRVRVEGIVQGVGFRPYVFGLATRLALAGFVGNDAQGVFLEIEGPEAAVAEFLRVLETEPPPLAVIERVTAQAVTAVGEERFTIVESRTGGESQALISPDTA